ncbi:MAG: hypothetical protein KJ709_01875 [Nanoarchaeota archaeon]|nr:hypothetical protein [Nanoarchaeota archaeon]
MLPKSKAASLRDRNIALTKKDIRESVTPDQMIIQALYSYDELTKIAHNLAGRIRGWFSLTNPELEHRISDNRAFVEQVLEKETKSAMGARFSDPDMKQLKELAKSCLSIFQEQEKLIIYIDTLMKRHMPNVFVLVGGKLGARLLSMAGSSKKLARMPASTIQLLGAEKALFRHLINKKVKPPKHGVLHEHPLVQKADRNRRGKIARTLADKLAIAAKVDYFGGKFMGDKLLKMIR